VKNLTKKREGFVEEKNFEKVFASALKDRYFSFEDPEIGKWIESFVQGVRPLLEELYGKYKFPLGIVLGLTAVCKFAPAPQEFPRELRNRRQREKAAARLDKAAEVIHSLQPISMYGIELFSCPALDISLKAAATRIRKVKSVPGRPQNRIMKEYAIILAELFRLYSVPSMYSHIATLLKAAYPDRWLSHGDDIDAVKKLIGDATTKDVFKEITDDLPEVEMRAVTREYEKNFDRSRMKATAYESYLKALLELVVGTDKRGTLPSYGMVKASKGTVRH
jgi:hypothetical protein